MKAKPCTVVGDLAICARCDSGPQWIAKYQIWVHQSSNNQHCGMKDVND